jgi:hypothetical protein
MGTVLQAQAVAALFSSVVPVVNLHDRLLDVQRTAHSALAGFTCHARAGWSRTRTRFFF